VLRSKRPDTVSCHLLKSHRSAPWPVDALGRRVPGYYGSKSAALLNQSHSRHTCNSIRRAHSAPTTSVTSLSAATHPPSSSDRRCRRLQAARAFSPFSPCAVPLLSPVRDWELGVSPAQVRPRQLVTRFNPLFPRFGSSRFVVQCTRRRVRGGNAASPRNRRHLSGIFRRERRCSRLRRIAGFPRLKAHSASTRCHDAAFNVAGAMLKIWLVFLFCPLLRREYCPLHKHNKTIVSHSRSIAVAAASVGIAPTDANYAAAAALRVGLCVPNSGVA